MKPIPRYAKHALHHPTFKPTSARNQIARHYVAADWVAVYCSRGSHWHCSAPFHATNAVNAVNRVHWKGVQQQQLFHCSCRHCWCKVITLRQLQKLSSVDCSAMNCSGLQVEQITAQCNTFAQMQRSSAALGENYTAMQSPIALQCCSVFEVRQ